MINVTRIWAKLVVVEAIVQLNMAFLMLWIPSGWYWLANPQELKRVMKRSQLTYDEARKRIKSQMSDEMYISIADQIIYNDGTLIELEESLGFIEG